MKPRRERSGRGLKKNPPYRWADSVPRAGAYTHEQGGPDTAWAGKFSESHLDKLFNRWYHVGEVINMTPFVGFRLASEVRAQLEEIAKERKTSLSEVIKLAIDEFLKQNRPSGN